MKTDKLTLYNFQAQLFIDRMENSLALLRQYADSSGVVVANHIESDLADLKRNLNIVEETEPTPQPGEIADTHLRVTHTAYPDGSVQAYRYGMTKPKLTCMGYIMKQAALRAAIKQGGLKVA